MRPNFFWQDALRSVNFVAYLVVSLLPRPAYPVPAGESKGRIDVAISELVALALRARSY